MSKAIRPIRIAGNLAYITLTQGYEAVIDAADVPLINGVNWHARKNRNTIYALRNAPRDENGKSRQIGMHRVLMGEPNCFVDHRDCDGLNNRRENLREATHAENAYNAGIRPDNTTGFKGVSWHKSAGRWDARIKVNGQRKHLGLFDTPEAAHAAYRAASAELHGEFGRTE